jgi:drug/metabolite transporter (DMT)-like permease
LARVTAGAATRRSFLPELALVAATVAYGSTFKVVQNALEHTTPTGFILLRFGVGVLALAPFAWRAGWRRRDVERAEPARAFVVAVLAFGAVGFVGYWFQNAGLERTSTSNSAFITGLFVVFTPLIDSVVHRRFPPHHIVAAVVIAAAGLFLLTGARPTLGLGDALTLGGAACFGGWIYLGSLLAQRFDPVALTAGQMIVLALLAVPAVAVQGVGHVDGGVVAAALLTGIVCSALAFTVQLWGQRFVEPSRSAVIVLFEPVDAGVVGYFVGERLGFNGYLGAALILASILVAEFAARRTPGPAA